MSDEFSRWYNRQFSNMSAQPPEEAWDAIVAGLDKPKPLGYGRRSVLLLIAVLFVSSPFMFPLLMTETKENKATVLTAEFHKKNSNSSSAERRDVFNAAADQNVISNSAKYSSVAPNTAVPKPENSAAYNHQSSQEKSPGTPFHTMGFNNAVKQPANVPAETSMMLPNNAGASPFVNTEPVVEPETVAENKTENNAAEILPPPGSAEANEFVSDHDSVKTRHFAYAGPGFHAGGILLLNSETFSALSSSGLNRVKMLPGVSFSFTAAMKYGHSLWIEGGYYFQKSAVEFLEYSEGFVREKKISMQVHSLTLTARRKLIGKAGETKGFYLLTGVGMNMLARQQTMFEGELVDATPYHRFTPSALVGAEYAFHLSKNMILRPQVMASVGLNNIYEGNALMPSAFMRTHLSDLKTGISLVRKF